MKRQTTIILTILSILFLQSCGSGQLLGPAFTPTPTNTSSPTLTFTPTLTSTQTSTSTPTFTFTITPTFTDTPLPTNTPTFNARGVQTVTPASRAECPEPDPSLQIQLPPLNLHNYENMANWPKLSDIF